MNISNTNDIVFVDKNIIENNIKFNKEDLNPDENTRSYSISTTATFENDFLSEDEIDFNQDFFPKMKTIKLTDYLVDNWELKIKMYLTSKKLSLKKNLNI